MQPRLKRSVGARTAISRPLHRTALATTVGVVLGLLLTVALAVVAAGPGAGDPASRPAVLAGLAAIAVAAVLTATRWPVVGGVTGVVLLLVTAFAVVQGVSWSTETGAWLDPSAAVGSGAVSGHPTLLGGVLVAVSWTRRRRGGSGRQAATSSR